MERGETMEADLEERERQYLNAVAEKWCVLRAGDAEIPLTDVFVMLEATERSAHTPLQKHPELPRLRERLEHAGMPDFPGGRDIPARLLLREALKGAEHMVLLGEPGAGKSTTLQFVGLCFAQGGWARERLGLEEDRVPILLDLKRYSGLLSGPGPALEEASAKEVAQCLRDEGEALELVRKLREEGRLLLLLDGLDEVPEGERPGVREEIADFARSPSGRKCRILVASRLVGYAPLGGGFREFVLKPFQDPKEALPYLKNWLAALRPGWKDEAEARAEALLAEMERHPPLRRVLDNPLLLRLMAEVYAGTERVARSRAEIYGRWVDELWERAVRRGAPREKKKEALEQLEEVAWGMHNGREVGLTDEDQELLREKLGLIVQIDRRRWAFSHLTIREYFVARRLKRAWEMNRPGAWRFLKPRLHVPEWREPLLLLAGLLRAEDCVELIRRVEGARSRYEEYLGRDLLLALRLWGEAREVLPDIGARLIHRALNHEEPGVRAAAARILGEIKSPEAVPHLIEALKDEDVGVRRAAARALGGIGSPEAIPHLIRALGDEDARVRSAAAEALRGIGSPEAIPHLIRALEDEAPFVRWAAAEALAGIGSPEAIPHLIRALEDEAPFVRWAAAEALAEINSPDAVPCLNEVLKDEDEDMRLLAARALGKIKFPEVVPHLVRALKREEWVVRWVAAEALGEIKSPKALQDLIQALRDEDEWVRAAAAGAIGKIKSPEAIPHLIEALKGGHWIVRWAAAKALGEIGSPEAVPHLVRALRDEEGTVRGAAARALKGCLANIQPAESEWERCKAGELLDKIERELWRLKDSVGNVLVHDLLPAVLERKALLEPPPKDPLSPEAISGWRGKWEKIKPITEIIGFLAAIASLASLILKRTLVGNLVPVFRRRSRTGLAAVSQAEISKLIRPVEIPGPSRGWGQAPMEPPRARFFKQVRFISGLLLTNQPGPEPLRRARGFGPQHFSLPESTVVPAGKGANIPRFHGPGKEAPRFPPNRGLLPAQRRALRRKSDERPEVHEHATPRQRPGPVLRRLPHLAGGDGDQGSLLCLLPPGLRRADVGL